MCGIAGFIGSGAINVEAVLASMRHRGPDGVGETSFSVKNTRVWLAHTRLSILDLSPAGAQPMMSRDGRWAVTFNGEIYNHEHIRQQLDVPFRGHSDTETLVESLARWGVGKTLSSLNGMFAFAALDLHAGVLYIVRDPFGVKPLYYTAGQHFAFASEIRALSALRPNEVELDLDSLQTFLTLRFVPSPKTLFKNIHRLAPGHFLAVDITTLDIHEECYVRPQNERFTGSLDEACQRYEEKLEAAIARQLLSDVPVGLLLSGGIDSSVIAAMAAKYSPGLNTFTVGFGKGFSECEIADAAETAQFLGLKHDSVRVDSDDLMSTFCDVARAIEEPLGTTSTLIMWHLARLARESVTVALTGQGSDEPWGGYLLYQSELIRSYLPFPSAFGGLASPFMSLPQVPSFLKRGVRAVRVREEAQRFAEARCLFSSQERLKLTGRSDDGEAVSSIRAWAEWMQDVSMSSTERMMRTDTHMNLPDDLLLYGDKISMAFSLETRVPMLDLDLMEYVESLPLSYRVTLGRRKIAHKKMALNFLPEKIVSRPKRRFEVPFGEWARSSWKDFIYSVLFDHNAKYLNYVDKPAVSELWKTHQSGVDCSRQLFAAIMLALCVENM